MNLTQFQLLIDLHSIFKVSFVLKLSQQRGLQRPTCCEKAERAAIPRYQPAYPKRAVVCRQGGADDSRLCFGNGLKPLGICSFTDSNPLIPK